MEKDCLKLRSDKDIEKDKISVEKADFGWIITVEWCYNPKGKESYPQLSTLLEASKFKASGKIS